MCPGETNYRKIRKRFEILSFFKVFFLDFDSNQTKPCNSLAVLNMTFLLFLQGFLVFFTFVPGKQIMRKMLNQLFFLLFTYCTNVLFITNSSVTNCFLKKNTKCQISFRLYTKNVFQTSVPVKQHGYHWKHNNDYFVFANLII